MSDGILGDLKVNIPDLGKYSLPMGGTLDLRQVDNAAEKMLGSTTEMAVGAVFAVALIVLGWLLASRLATWTQRALVRAKVEETPAAFMGSIARYTLFLLSVFGAFKLLGVGLTSAVALFGAIGLAVAFALRNTVSHIAAGIMLVVNRPFKIGDYIQLDNVEGTVKRITLFNTEINTTGNHRVFIPNTKIWENTFWNHSYNEARIVDLKVGFGFNDKPLKVIALLKKIVDENKYTLTKPEPTVTVDAFGDSAVIYAVKAAVRTRDHGAAKSLILIEILEGAAKHGFDMPYPQRVVHTVAKTGEKRGRK